MELNNCASILLLPFSLCQMIYGMDASERHATGRPNPALWVTAPILCNQLAGTKEQSSKVEREAAVRGFLGRLHPQGPLFGAA